MTMAKKLPLLAPSIHTFEVNGTYKDCEARRTVFMAIQKMVSAGKYYRIPYHGSSKKGYSYKRKDGGLTITLADYPDFKKRYITLSGVNLARIAGDPSRLSLTDLSPEGCNGVQREHNKKLNNGLPILHKVPPKRDYGRYFCIMAEKGGTSHGGLTEKLSPFFHAKKQEVNAYGR